MGNDCLRRPQDLSLENPIAAGFNRVACYKVNLAAETKGIKLDSEIKVWMSKDVPLSGMVKMEMTSNLANMTMELAGTGRK